MHPDCLVSAEETARRRDLSPECATVAAQARWSRSHRAEIEAEEDAVRVEVDPNICEGHGQCNAIAPEVYDLDEGGYCLIHNPEVPPELESQARAGALACPVQAIMVTR